jgi:hypothetical protein
MMSSAQSLMRYAGAVALTWFCLAGAQAQDPKQKASAQDDAIVDELTRDTEPICDSVFNVKLTAKDGSKRDDTLDICDGKLSLTLLEDNDFESPRYSSRQKGDKLIFHASASGKSGKLTVAGVIRGSAVAASIVWRKPSGQSERYELRGKHCPYPCF